MEFSREEKGRLEEVAGLTYDILVDVVRGNRMHHIKWMRELGFGWYNRMLDVAINDGGSLELVQWIVLNNCCGKFWAVEYAAGAGRLDIVKWAFEHGYRLDDNDAVQAAIAGGHLEVVKWLLENGYECSESALITAIEDDKPEMAEYILEQEGFVFEEELMRETIREGHFKSVKWLENHGCPWDQSMILLAIDEDQKEIAKWLVRACYAD